jgi:hypothetical protein
VSAAGGVVLLDERFEVNTIVREQRFSLACGVRQLFFVAATQQSGLLCRSNDKPSRAQQLGQ